MSTLIRKPGLFGWYRETKVNFSKEPLLVFLGGRRETNRKPLLEVVEGIQKESHDLTL